MQAAKVGNQVWLMIWHVAVEAAAVGTNMIAGLANVSNLLEAMNNGATLRCRRFCHMSLHCPLPVQKHDESHHERLCETASSAPSVCRYVYVYINYSHHLI
ncbi:hypothetical protein OG21DRAFT_1090991 [Imleria badia]|nr:hypothetical protein OG21DRAFT_1090991 [Imleria badia]